MWQQGDGQNFHPGSGWCEGECPPVYTPRTWQEAVDYCTALDLPGSGWRLPTRLELLTLVNYGLPYPDPAIDARYFPTDSDPDTFKYL